MYAALSRRTRSTAHKGQWTWLLTGARMEKDRSRPHSRGIPEPYSVAGLVNLLDTHVQVA
jgi:hypothetical protein